jgi:hypothetical protein
MQKASGVSVEKRPSIHGEKVFDTVRRFVIVDTRHNICLQVYDIKTEPKLTLNRPILTYSGQGAIKRAVHPEDRAMIYASTRTSTRTSEQRSLLRKHIHKDTLETTNKLDPMSRLNYGKLYTVEHNVKSGFIRGVDAKSTDHDPDLNHGMYMNEEELTRSDKESGSTSKFLANGVPIIAQGQIINCPLRNKLDSRLYVDDTVRTSDWGEDYDDCKMVFEGLDGWELVEEHGELFLILDSKTCDCDSTRNAHFQRLTRVVASPKVLAGLGVGSGLLMGASFLWLNKKMELNHTSPIMGWVRTSHLLPRK